MTRNIGRLQLNRETLRRLAVADLTAVEGGLRSAHSECRGSCEPCIGSYTGRPCACAAVEAAGTLEHFPWAPTGKRVCVSGLAICG